MTKPNRLNRVLSIICIVLLLVALAWVERHVDPYTVRILHMWGLNAIFAVAFNLLYGYTGQFSLGNAGLAAVGAYTMALLTLTPEQKLTQFIISPAIWPISVIHWPFLPSLLMAGIMAALVGFLIGAPALRLRGDYLVIATLGFSEIIRMVLCNLPAFCNGSLGLLGLPRDATLVWTWGLVVVSLFVTKRLVDSSYGRALKTIRDNEIAAEAMGVSLFRHKILSFVVSSFFIGIAGALLAQILGTVAPSVFTSAFNTGVITMVVLGGVGSLTGSVIAAGIYVIMSEVLRAAESPRIVFGFHLPAIPGLRMLVFALMLIGLMLFFRRGLLGSKEFSWDWVRGKLRAVSSRQRGAL
jgi:branched-chain amino acid transport system permease protein